MVKNPSVNAGDAGSIPGLGRPPGESESEVAQSLSVRLLATPWTAASQAPPSTEVSRQEYWSGLPFPSLQDLPYPRIEPRSPALQEDALLSEPPG